MSFINWLFGIKKAPELEYLQYQIDNYKPEMIILGHQDIRDIPTTYICTYRSCCGNFIWKETIPVIYNLQDSFEYYGKRLYVGWRIEKLTTMVDGVKIDFLS